MDVFGKTRKEKSAPLGAEVSFHRISWQNSGRMSTVSAPGNIHYHNVPRGGLKPETRDFSQIVFILSGHIIEDANGEKRPLSPNTAVFIRPDDIHGWEAPPKMETCEMLVFSFELELFLTLSEYFEDDSFLQRYTESVLPPVFRLDGREINDLSVKLLSINSAKIPISVSRVKLKLALAELFVSCFLDGELTGDFMPEWLNQLCELMRKEENFVPGLKRMQQLSGYTPEYLCKAFRKYLNKTPTEFINELRINFAARLLSDTELPIGEIAYRLNFQSLSRFYHLFNRIYHMSPAKYRLKSMGLKYL